MSQIWKHHTRGYEILIDPDQSPARSPGIMHHRLIAWAHGELEELSEPVEIDHLTPIPWYNRAENLEAVGPIEHGQRTRARARSRREA